MDLSTLFSISIILLSASISISYLVNTYLEIKLYKHKKAMMNKAGAQIQAKLDQAFADLGETDD